MDLTGVLLMFALGLRHGVDPDHITVIDGMSMRFANTNPGFTKWIGTLFALGHGSAVTVIAVAISQYGKVLEIDPAVWSTLEYLPGLLLILVGVANFYQLQKSAPFKALGPKMFLIPKRLLRSSSPVAVIVIGICFALVFDTTTQVTAWTYSSTGEKSGTTAFFLGCIFSLGMIATDTLDSRVLYRLLNQSQQAGGPQSKQMITFRRGLGWIIVILSIVVGTYQLMSHLFPWLALSEITLSLAGLSFLSIIIAFYVRMLFLRKKTFNTYDHGD